MKKLKGFDLEAVYDSEIAPLMKRIIDICKAHKLPMFSTFLYASDAQDGHDLCTTNLMFEERKIPCRLASLEPTIRGERSPSLRIQVRNSAGEVTEETMIIP
jgi:hypothetical protein